MQLIFMRRKTEIWQNCLFINIGYDML